MKAYIKINSKNIIICRATEECNLHGIGTNYLIDNDGIPGDEYNPSTKILTEHPENYPQLSQIEKDEELIQERIVSNTRMQAVTELKDEGKLPPDFESEQTTKEI